MGKANTVLMIGNLERFLSVFVAVIEWKKIKLK